MGDLVKNVFSFMVWTVEFLCVWAIMWYAAPGLAWAILVFVLGCGAIGAFFGFLAGWFGYLDAWFE